MWHGQVLPNDVPIRRPGMKFVAKVDSRVSALWEELKKTDSMERKIEINSEIVEIGKRQRGESCPGP